MRKSKRMQLGAMLTVMLLVSMAFVPAVNANVVGEDLADCGCSGEYDITAVQLSGSEANKAIVDTLKNDKVKELRNELIERGYTPMVNDAEVVLKVTATNGNVTDEVISTMIPFKSQSGEGNATIAYMMSNGEEDAQAIIQNGQVLTVIKGDDVYTSGPASVFSEPMDILKGNTTYQGIVANLTAQGYVIDEENANVIVNESSNRAGINVNATGLDDTRFILAIVDLESERAISVDGLTCEDICEEFCEYLSSVPCAVGCVKICKINIICLGVCLSVCYIIHEHGCEPGCAWLCDQL